MKKHKILYICTEQSPGMVPYATQIIRTMAHSSLCEIYVLYVIDGRDCYRELLPESIAQFTYTIPENKCSRLLYKIAPFDLINQIEKIGLMHSLNYIHLLTVDYVLGHFIKRIRRFAHIVYTVHDVYPHEVRLSFYEKLTNFYIQRQCSAIQKKVSNLVTNSLFQYQTLQKWYPKKKIQFHHFPSLVTDVMKNSEIVPAELKGITEYILFFGTLHIYKGVKFLYQAYRKSRAYSHKLVIAGSGNLEFEYEKEDTNRIIRINRFITDAEVSYLYKNALCVVYPYISATQSGVLSLAYHFRTPLIATKIDFFEEHIIDGKTGILCSPHDIESLCNCLNAITDKTFNKEEMQAEQMKHYSEVYSPTQLMKEIETIYTENIYEK